MVWREGCGEGGAIDARGLVVEPVLCVPLEHLLLLVLLLLRGGGV